MASIWLGTTLVCDQKTLEALSTGVGTHVVSSLQMLNSQMRRMECIPMGCKWMPLILTILGKGFSWDLKCEKSGTETKLCRKTVVT